MTTSEFFLTCVFFLIEEDDIQLEAEVFNPPDVFPLIPTVNKSCNIESCVNNMLQIIQNMMVSQCSELELSMFLEGLLYQVSIH